MREIIVDGEKRKIHAAPLSAYIYETSFGTTRGIDDDVNAFIHAKRGPVVALPAMPILRLLYVFERTAAVKENLVFPDFDVWLDALPEDILDQTPRGEGDTRLSALFDEVVRCFFRGLYRPDKDVDPAGEGREAEGATE
jgi:hypothetical protein